MKFGSKIVPKLWLKFPSFGWYPCLLFVWKKRSQKCSVLPLVQSKKSRKNSGFVNVFWHFGPKCCQFDNLFSVTSNHILLGLPFYLWKWLQNDCRVSREKDWVMTGCPSRGDSCHQTAKTALAFIQKSWLISHQEDLSDGAKRIGRSRLQAMAAWVVHWSLIRRDLWGFSLGKTFSLGRKVAINVRQ